MRISDDALGRLGGLVARENAPMGLVFHDRYEVRRRLARGGMGEIFRAQDLRLNRPVAMKILASGLSDPEWAVRFEEEARTMGRIDHPGIVPIHDLGIMPDGRLFYTMKLIDGNTLDELIASGEDRARLLRILAKTCEAVHHAHARGVVHRDLKPSNIMIGPADQVYVLDWGIARVLGEASAPGGDGATAGAGYTSAGSVLGTLPYMPPEQARGDIAAIDARSDVYALGAVLYEILTAIPPVEGGSVTEILEAIARGRIHPPRSLDPSIAPDLEAICLKALRRDPRRRYVSALEFGKDLDRWLGGDPVRAFSGKFGYSVLKRIRKHRILSCVIGAAILLGAAFCTYWFAHREDRAAAEAKRREDQTFGPLRKRLEQLPATAEGWKRGAELLRTALRDHSEAWEGWMALAALLEKLGESEAALEALLRACQINPRLGIAHYRRGSILMDHLERPDQAREEFERALRIEPDNEFAMIGQARVAATRGQFRESLEILRRAEPTSRHLDDFFFLRGYLRIAEDAGEIRDADAAISDISTALRMNPQRAVAHVNLAVAYMDKGENDRALKILDQALALSPVLWGAYSNRGQIFRERGDLDRAIADYTTAIELNPRNANALTKRGVARHDRKDLDGAIADHDRALEINPRMVAAYLNRANVRRDKGDVAGALADCSKAIELKPGFAECYVVRGEVNRSQARLKEALADYDRAITLNPKLASAYVNRAVAKYQAGDLEGTIADTTRAIELAPRLAPAYANRANARGDRGDVSGALADYARAIEFDPRFANAYSARGVTRSENDDLEGAIADLDRAVELEPANAGHYFNRATVRRRRREHEGALADCTKALELAPAHAKASFLKGSIRLSRGDARGAILDFTHAIRQDPRYTKAYNDRGAAYLELGDLDRALFDFNQALAVSPDDRNALSNRGMVRLKQRDLDGALSDFAALLARDPDDATALFGRGMAKGRKGDEKGGAEDLERALALAPAGWPYREAARKVLSDLRK